MPTNILSYNLNYLKSKIQIRNAISAVFHMITVSSLSMSLVQVQWFEISGDVCSQYLTLQQFFWLFGYDSSNPDNDYRCINNTVVNLMRIILLLCFMAIIFSLGGFILDISQLQNKVLIYIQQYALCSSFTVFWVMAIVSFCYYTTLVIQESLDNLYPKLETSVTYGFGFYLVAITGGVALLGNLCSLILHQTLNERSCRDGRCLLERYDSLEAFDASTPPPPYSIPPPPYVP